MIKRIVLMLFLVMVAALFSGCLARVPEEEAVKPAGFFMGIWHGWIAPVALVAKIFRPEFTVFARNNTGFWYELGFYMAIVSGFGGIGFARGSSHSSRGKKNRTDRFDC